MASADDDGRGDDGREFIGAGDGVNGLDGLAHPHAPDAATMEREAKRSARHRAADLRAARRAARGAMLAAIGLEAEFSVKVDGEPVRPEDAFGSPRRFIRGPMVHRTGRSYHLPMGSAIYFDTGVVELATPMIEIAPGCAAQAGRSLWEALHFVRGELDAWEGREGKRVELGGFSAHYNVSFDVPAPERRAGRTVERLALLLTYLLPVPVMLLAANRRSTGIGVRPRGNRVEVTADFTPDAALMIAAATLSVGIIRSVMQWRNFGLEELDAHRLPVVEGFAPIPHSSRQGWVAKFSCFPANPFTSDVDEPMWRTTQGDLLSLRDLAGRVTRAFWPEIARIADPLTLRLISAVMAGRAPSLLELPDRPPAYDDVGRLCTWEDLFPERLLPRSRYERAVIHAISGERLRVADDLYTATGMDGWTHAVFRRERDGRMLKFSLDEVADRLDPR